MAPPAPPTAVVHFAMDDSDSDTIRVAPAPPNRGKKRQVIDISQSDDDEITYEPLPKRARKSTIRSANLSSAYQKRAALAPTTNAAVAATQSKILDVRQALVPIPSETVQRNISLGGLGVANLQNKPIGYCEIPRRVKSSTGPFFANGTKTLKLNNNRLSTDHSTDLRAIASPIELEELHEGSSILGDSLDNGRASKAPLLAARPRRVLADSTAYDQPNSWDDLTDGQSKTKTRKETFASPAVRSRKAVEDESDFEDDCNEARREHDHTRIGPSDDDSFGFGDSPTDKKTVSKHTRRKPRNGGEKSKSLRMTNLICHTSTPALNFNLAPMNNTNDIFLDLTKNGLGLGFDKAVRALHGCTIRVATLCSGTESPLLALEMINKSLKTLRNDHDLDIDHLFSAEIVPFKQAYIERNFRPKVIFRDIRELTRVAHDPEPMATTAYGGLAPVPVNVDMVIAGTSCVDYSNKNSHKKKIHDGGESGDTWYYALEYCRTVRPAIVILENVRGAPWDTMLADYEAVGYEAAGALVDTKAYYIPHTRHRGYMVCFEKNRLSTAAEASGQWTAIMEKLKRPASSPATDFALPPDAVVHRNIIRDNESSKRVQWARCAVRAMGYRLEQGVGIERPITHWSESGTMALPDFSQHDAFRGREERVLDFMDVAYMRKTLPRHGMYDPRYKARFLELSQNIDREQDSRQFGIMPCITPTGRTLVTDRGKETVPEEMLMLQGFPLHRISFTTETDSEIRDLAGNAMSTPVIGAAILSALMVGYSSIVGLRRTAARYPSAPSAATPCLEDGKWGTKQFTYPRTDGGSLDLAKLLDASSKASRLCYCEGSTGTSIHHIQSCVECGHTVCAGCGGNPLHNYRLKENSDLVRISAIQFEELAKEILPLRIHFSQDVRANVQARLGLSEVPYQDYVSAAFRQKFSLHRLQRTHCWTALYCASAGDATFTLELVLDRVVTEWRLYAHVSRVTPLSDVRRKLLRPPIAVAMVKDNLLGSPWQIRPPQEITISATITGSGQHIASMWSRRCMPNFTRHRLWKFLTIEGDGLPTTLAGKYQYLPNCGTSHESLYQRIRSRSDPESEKCPIYLFMDPTRIGQPHEDCFVFSKNIAKLEPSEVRPILARIERPWLPWNASGGEMIEGKTHGNVVLDPEWLDCDARLSAVNTELVTEQPKTIEQTDCTHAFPLLQCTVFLDDAAGSAEDKCMDELTQAYKWALEASRDNLPGKDWTTLHVPGEKDHICSLCAPQRPRLRWMALPNGNIAPYEDPASASEHERAMKGRPSSCHIALVPGPSELRLSLFVNLIALAHRARAGLPQWLTSRPHYRWRVKTTIVKPFIFNAFQLHPTLGVEPWHGTSDLKVSLFPKQRRTLQWMRKQESGIEVVIEEGCEDRVQHLGWRLEVVAQTSVRLRGGICADHPGFGKTITTLALISSEFHEMERRIIESDLDLYEPEVDLIRTAATLIVCPWSLVKQWQSEIQDKLGWQREVVTISSFTELAKLKIKDFQAAKIIVVSRSVFAQQRYVDALAAFAAVPGPRASKGRAFEEWLKAALSEVPKHTKILQDNGKDGISMLKAKAQKTYEAHILSKRFKLFEPSRRRKGADYVASKTEKKPTSSASLAATLDTSTIGVPLFHQFIFNRISIDEFHQYDPVEYAMVTKITARKRWGLSGTPAINDFWDVTKMAQLLNVPLPRGTLGPSVTLRRNISKFRDECTPAEEFEELQQVCSEAGYARIHSMQQRFLDLCVRRNIMDLADIEYSECLVPVSLARGHQALYMEVLQHLSSTDLHLKRMGNSTDRRRRLDDLFSQCTLNSAEEALSRQAALMDTDIDELVKLRETEVAIDYGRLPTYVRNAKKLEPQGFENWKTAYIQKGGLGDQEVIDDVRSVLEGRRSFGRDVEESHQIFRGISVDQSSAESDAMPTKPKGRSKNKNKRSKGESKGKNDRVADLATLCDLIVVAKRSLRFLKNFRLLSQGRQHGKKPKTQCDHPDCDGHATEHAVVILCGHRICQECAQAREVSLSTACPAPGCRTAVLNEHIVWRKDMGSSHATTHGAKLDAAIRLLREISEQDDQAILFVQYKEQLAEAERALDECNISSIVVKSTNSAGGQFEKFRNVRNGKDKTTVIVLNASDETAAGSNLQNANHVIFLSPLLKATQYEYDSTMAQAIGRVRRHGQKKKIHVYRIVALNTIDVDILEHRERRNDALVEIGENIIQPPSTSQVLNMDNRNKPARTQLVKENGKFSLRPRSWLRRYGDGGQGLFGQNGKVRGWEEYGSLIKFSTMFMDDD